MGKPMEDRTIPLAVAAEEGHGVGGVRRLHLVQVLRDDVIGFIPRDRLELAFASLTDTAKGGLDSVLPVYIVPQTGALGTQLAIIQRMPGCSLYPNDLAILYITVYTAVDARAADSTQGVLHFNAGVLAWDLGFDLLL